MSGGVTTNYGLAKPDFNSRPWDGKINSNFDLIDTLLYTLFQVPNIVGVWKNSTAYTAGQNVLDPANLVFYNCLVTHVSAAAGSFAADRTANPSYWTLTQPQVGSLRYDIGQALTTPQMILALSNLGVLSTVLGLSATQQDYLRLNVLGATGTLNINTNTALAITDIEKTVYLTGSPTLTMPNFGSAWTTGPIVNDNALTGTGTISVPTGATLDGVLNGTINLAPKQIIRIRQIGPTAYRSMWVDRTPVVAVRSITSAVAAADLVLPEGYPQFDIDFNNIGVDTSGASIGFRISTDGGSTFKAGATDYFNVINSAQNGSANPTANSGNLSYAEIAAALLPTGIPATGSTTLAAGDNTNKVPAFVMSVAHTNNSSVSFIRQSSARYNAVARANGLRLIASTGNISSGIIVVRGTGL